MRAIDDHGRQRYQMPDAQNASVQIVHEEKETGSSVRSS